MTIDEGREVAGGERRAAYLRVLAEFDKQINAFTCIEPNEIDGDGERPLANAPCGIKDNIAVEGMALTCASDILGDFVSPYSATVVERLQRAGAVVVGKCNLDEFGMGSSTEHSRFGATHNPWDRTRVAGGSSGGSAAAVAAGMVSFALGSDTGGSVRQPASFCGVYGLKPTYGYLSRFGLVAYASSLEVIGIISSTAGDARTVFNIAAARDANDQTSVQREVQRTNGRRGRGKQRSVGYLRELPHCDDAVRVAYSECVEQFRSIGYACNEIEIPLMEYICPAYYTIATAEASANLARYDGVRYGLRSPGAETTEEMVRRTRSRGFGSEVKLRVLVGSYVLRAGFQERFYLRAQNIRRHLKHEIARVHTACDIILLPTFPTLPFSIGTGGLNSLQQKQGDRFTCLSNLTGAPALSIPVGIKEGLPVGMQLIGAHGQEDMLFAVAEKHRASVDVEIGNMRPEIYFDPSVMCPS